MDCTRGLSRLEGSFTAESFLEARPCAGTCRLGVLPRTQHTRPKNQTPNLAPRSRPLSPFAPRKSVFPAKASPQATGDERAARRPRSFAPRKDEKPFSIRSFAERKTAIWELALRASINLGAYLPPSRHGIVTFCLLLGWQPLSTRGHLCHVRGSRLAILVHQGSDPT